MGLGFLRKLFGGLLCRRHHIDGFWGFSAMIPVDNSTARIFFDNLVSKIPIGAMTSLANWCKRFWVIINLVILIVRVCNWSRGKPNC